MVVMHAQGRAKHRGRNSTNFTHLQFKIWSPFSIQSMILLQGLTMSGFYCRIAAKIKLPHTSLSLPTNKPSIASGRPSKTLPSKLLYITRYAIHKWTKRFVFLSHRRSKCFIPKIPSLNQMRTGGVLAEACYFHLQDQGSNPASPIFFLFFI